MLTDTVAAPSIAKTPTPAIEPPRLPRAVARLIFTPSADIGRAYAWTCPYCAEITVSTELPGHFPHVAECFCGRGETLLKLGEPIWLAKWMMAGWPGELPDLLYDYLDEMFDREINTERKRHKWLLSKPVVFERSEII